ncbi:hypothetical protein GE061_009632 [Apolygus lucorum]|uniref:Uncharacterized protein n=1 Tax=Apolygus lucorum TaxID=248454 RepID=A0A6A4KDL2_APOLU|nr:hypothetical protein GE061_009632 [Apolygus lucorum]
MVEDIPTSAVTELSFNTATSFREDLSHNRTTSDTSPNNEPPIHKTGTGGGLQAEEASRTEAIASAYQSPPSPNFATRRKHQETGEAAGLLHTGQRTYAEVTAGQNPANTAPDKAYGNQETRSLNDHHGYVRTYHALSTPHETADMESHSNRPSSLQEKGRRGSPLLPRQKHKTVRRIHT